MRRQRQAFRPFTPTERWALVCSTVGGMLLSANIVVFNVVHYSRPLYFALLAVFCVILSLAAYLMYRSDKIAWKKARAALKARQAAERAEEERWVEQWHRWQG